MMSSWTYLLRRLGRAPCMRHFQNRIEPVIDRGRPGDCRIGPIASYAQPSPDLFEAAQHHERMIGDNNVPWTQRFQMLHALRERLSPFPAELHSEPSRAERAIGVPPIEHLKFSGERPNRMARRQIELEDAVAHLESVALALARAYWSAGRYHEAAGPFRTLLDRAPQDLEQADYDATAPLSSLI